MRSSNRAVLVLVYHQLFEERHIVLLLGSMIFHAFLLSPTMIVFFKDVGRLPSRFWSRVLWWIFLRNVEFLHPTRSNPLVTIYHIPMLHCAHFLWSYWDRVKWFNVGHWNHEVLQWICDVGFLAHKDVSLRTCSHKRYISDISCHFLAFPNVNFIG